jgi:hypothetical protein
MSARKSRLILPGRWSLAVPPAPLLRSLPPVGV